MRCYANQLPSQLKKGLAPFYMVFGEEPYQIAQCIMQIRQAAKQQGFGSKGKSNNEKNQSMDAVMIGVVMLLGISATVALGERLNSSQKTQLGAGAVGAAAGLAIGYGVGRFRP